MSNILDSFFSELDIIDFAESSLILDGKPIEYVKNGRYFAADILRYMAHILPYSKKAKPVCILKSRQCGASVFSSVLLLYYIYVEKNKAFAHVFPEVNQARRHSSKRLIELIQDSVQKGKIPKNFVNNKGTQSLVQKDFFNNNTLYIEGLSTDARRLRGMSISGLMCYDEFADTTQDAYKNSLEAAANSHFGLIDNGKQVPHVVFGTPTTAGSLFEKIWTRSDKRNFFFKCPHCGHYLPIYYKIISRIESVTNMDHSFLVRCIDENGIGCQKSFDKRREAMTNGEWRSTISDDDKQRNQRTYGDETSFTGFYIPQYLLQPREIIEHKFRNDPIRTFINEVLGQFYSSIDETLTPNQIREYTTKNPDTSTWDVPTFIKDKKTFMGIDWGQRTAEEATTTGGSYSTVVIISQLPTNQIKVECAINIEKSDKDEQIQIVEELIRKYNCIKIVSDEGAAYTECQRLQKDLGTARFTSMLWEGSLKKGPNVYHRDVNRISTDKNIFYEEFFELLRQHKFVIPNSPNAEEKLSFLFEHLSNVESEIKDVNGIVKKMYSKKSGKNTDGLSALLSAYIAFLMFSTNNFQNQTIDRLPGGNMNRSSLSTFSLVSKPRQSNQQRNYSRDDRRRR